MVCIIIVQRCTIGDGLYHHGTVVCFISFWQFLDINCQFLKLFRLAKDH